MNKMLNLLLFVGISTSIIAQSQNEMKTEITTEGLIIKKGKMVYTEIRINASIDKVWNVFTDFEKYPEWNPFIKSLKGNPGIDKKIEVFLQPPTGKGMKFTPKVLKFENQKEFRWIGKLFLSRIFDGEHTFKLIDNQDGTTTFIQYEHFRGILIPFMKKMLDNDTKKGFENMNEALKIRCEVEMKRD